MADSQFNPQLNDDHILRSALGTSADCFSEETLAAMAETLAGMAESRLDDASLATAKAHLQSCAHCRNEAALLMEFQMATPRPEEMESVAWIESRLGSSTAGLGAPRSTTPRAAAAPERTRGSIAGWFEQAFAFRRWQALNRPFVVLAAACLLFVVAGGVYLRPGPAILKPVGIGEPVWRSLEFSAVSPAGDIANAPAELKWDSVPGAARYVAHVLEVDRTEIWKGESIATSLQLPKDLRIQMTAGRTFLWSVAAQDAAGRTLSESSLQSFHISATAR